MPRYPYGLTDRQVQEIKDLWHQRITIVRLAERYSVQPDVIRKIIAMPYDEGE